MITWISTGSYTDSYPVTFGGIQLGEFSVLEELANKKYSLPIHLIVVRQKGQKNKEKLFAGNLCVYRVKKPYSFKYSTDTEFRTAFAIRAKEIVHRLLVYKKTQLIQLCSVVPARCFLEWDILNNFAPKKSPKLIYTIHNSLTLAENPCGAFVAKTEEWETQKKAEIEVIKGVDVLICTSRSFKKFISKKYGIDRKIFYIPNTVGSYTFFKKIKKNENPQWSKTILFLGRLSREKRVDRVVEIFSYLIRGGHDYSLIIAGDGEEKDWIKKMIIEKGLKISRKKEPLPATVHMVGMITGETKWNILKSSRLMICLSDYEVSPLIGYEALALGVPIIASSLDQWKELVDDGINGFIVDGDDIELVARKIALIIESNTVYRKISLENIKKYKSKYDSKIIAKMRYGLVYAPLLNGDLK